MGLSDEEQATYEWQMWVNDFGRTGQQKLKAASVLISRIGGIGSVAAYELAAGGVGQLVLAHAGNIKHSDLNRQLLMTHDQLGESRIATASRRLKELNPRLDIISVPENVSENNASDLIDRVDLIVDCAPLFEERYAMNRQAVLQGKPMIEAAMYDLEAHLTTIIPGRSPCLACLYPERNPYWKRQFPVFGAVAGTIGCMAAMEAIKVLAGFGEPLTGRLLTLDLRQMTCRTRKTRKDVHCPVCGDR